MRYRKVNGTVTFDFIDFLRNLLYVIRNVHRIWKILIDLSFDVQSKIITITLKYAI
jgi:hypothetical protein